MKQRKIKVLIAAKSGYVVTDVLRENGVKPTDYLPPSSRSGAVVVTMEDQKAIALTEDPRIEFVVQW